MINKPLKRIEIIAEVVSLLFFPSNTIIFYGLLIKSKIYTWGLMTQSSTERKPFLGKSARFYLYLWVLPFLSVCVFVCVCYNREHRSYLSEHNKMLKKCRFVDFDICNQIASLRNLYSVTVTYFFQVKKIFIWIYLKR